MNVSVVTQRYLPPGQLSSWALTGAGCGLLAELAFLPAAVRALLLLAFVLVAPGSVVVEWMGTLALVAVRALVPLTGLSIVLLSVSGGLLLGFWSSRLMLVGLVVLTALGGVRNRRRSARALTAAVPAGTSAAAEAAAV